ncbi:MAG: DUF2683 family protein [Candidatus Pacearchaeota archaeon]
MVKAMIDIPEDVNHVLNIVKARFNLKDKSEAISRVVSGYGEDILEPELRPEYVKKAKNIMREKAVTLGNVKELRNIMGLE